MQRFRKCLLGLPAAAIAATTMAPAYAATIAYYRFEDGTDGAEVNPGSTTGNQIASSTIVTDYAGGDDPMVAYNGATSPNYTTNVSISVVPQTGASNTLSLDFQPNVDLFQNVTTGPLAAGVFTDFTVETYVQLDTISGWRTIIGRDDSGSPGQANGMGSLFYLSKSGANNGFRVEVITDTGTNVQVNSAFIPEVGTWYHLAAVGDATAGTLTLYVDGVSVGSATGYTGMWDSTTNSSWTIGRGQWNGSPSDFFDGRIDEVRFSDEALTTSQFLNAVPEPATLVLLGLGGLCMVARRR